MSKREKYEAFRPLLKKNVKGVCDKVNSAVGEHIAPHLKSVTHLTPATSVRLSLLQKGLSAAAFIRHNMIDW